MPIEPVKRGDLVDIVAPASRCRLSELKDGLRALESLGLKPRVPKGLFAPSVLFSNSDQMRFKQLKKALYAPDSKLIWCVRGGYGALRLIPELSRLKPPAQPKMFLGYSDITTLHSFLNQEWGWPTLHGPMLERFGRGVMPLGERQELLDILFGRQSSVEFSKLEPLNATARRSHLIRSTVVGGNMAVLQSSLGTRQAFEPKGRIVFFEDIGERPHRVDRMLTQFEQAGCFKNVKAVVFGHFLLGKALDRKHLWSDVMERFAKAQKFPVLKGLKVGHHAKFQRTLPLNTRAELSLGKVAQLKVFTGIQSSFDS